MHWLMAGAAGGSLRWCFVQEGGSDTILCRRVGRTQGRGGLGGTCSVSVLVTESYCCTTVVVQCRVS